MFFLRKSSLERLPVVMSGVRMGERALQIGAADAALVAAIATKVGLSGHAAVIVEQERESESARRAGDKAGALIEVSIAPLDALPYPAASFDVVVLHPAGLSHPLTPGAGMLSEAFRVLRSGGRLVIIEAGGSGFRRSAPSGDAAPILAAVGGAGFKAARILGQREGYRFIEGLKIGA